MSSLIRQLFHFVIHSNTAASHHSRQELALTMTPILHEWENHRSRDHRSVKSYRETAVSESADGQYSSSFRLRTHLQAREFHLVVSPVRLHTFDCLSVHSLIRSLSRRLFRCLAGPFESSVSLRTVSKRWRQQRRRRRRRRRRHLSQSLTLLWLLLVLLQSWLWRRRRRWW